MYSFLINLAAKNNSLKRVFFHIIWQYARCFRNNASGTENIPIFPFSPPFLSPLFFTIAVKQLEAIFDENSYVGKKKSPLQEVITCVTVGNTASPRVTSIRK